MEVVSMKVALLSVVVALAPVWGGCSGSSGPGPSKGGAGGGQAKGGSTGSGGATTGSGGSATGGTTASGGSATGGKTGGSGGVVATGGSTSTGGATSSGGGTGTGAGGGVGGAGTGGAGGRDAGATGGASGATSAGGSATGGGTGTATGGTGGGSTIVGATPPMGWNSWNNFGCNPSESLIKSTADAMVSSGMAAAGYQYVNIDDCWMSGRDGSGNLVADAAKFPSGIAALADYVHGKGLKLGIYESPGNTTCAGKTGTQGHETQDAQNYAKWGVDYLKYDLCSGQRSGFAKMGDALKATGRPIFYSINPVYGAGSCIAPPKCDINCPAIADMWRIEFDINASWGSFTGLIDFDKPLAQYASPGHWNDPDMLEVGRGMSTDEDKSHFGMWAILAAPLITGNDVTKMSATTKAILTNKDIIDVDQDPLGKQGTLIGTAGSNLEIWSKQLSGTNTRAVALFNRSGGAASMSVTWAQIGLPAGAATVRDLYAQKDLGSFTDSYKADSVPSHGIVMLKVVSGP
jgi:alpha-galactosidase